MKTVKFNKAGDASKPRQLMFSKPMFTFPEMLEPGATGVKATWEYTGNPGDIVHAKPGCTCTAQFEFVGNTVSALYTDTTVGPNGNNLSPADRQAGFKQFTKSVTLFVDDGIPLKVKNGMKSVFNKDKGSIQLQFTGKVDLSKFPPLDPSPKKQTH